MRLVLTFSIFMAAWLLWSGLYKPLVIGLGVLSCLLTLALARRMDAFSDHIFGLRLHPRIFGFWGWLGSQLVRSNIEVARIILSPGLPISPTVVEIDALPRGRLGQAILGNSITLTPGSLTIDDHEGKLLVHCLTESGARELESDEMNRRAAALTED